MRTVVIGDIHGCIVEFRELVERLALSTGDNLVLIGDLMDKGPDPAACVRYARELKAQMVLGNHEEKHLRWRKHMDRKAQDPKYKVPMKLPAEYAAQNAELSDEDIAWLRGLPIMLVLKSLGLDRDWVVVHGGLMPSLALEDQTDDRLRLRKVNTLTGKMHPVDVEKPNEPDPPGVSWWMQAYDRPENVVYGHAAHGLQEPRVDRNARGAECWGIDTGCAYGGSLTALVLETREVIQVKARQAYSRWFGSS